MTQTRLSPEFENELLNALEPFIEQIQQQQLQIDRLGQENQNLQKQLAALFSALLPLPQRLTALKTQTSKQNISTHRQLSQIANQLAAILPLELEEKRSLMLKLSDLLMKQQESLSPEMMAQLNHTQRQIQQSLTTIEQKPPVPPVLKLFLNGEPMSYRGIFLILVVIVNYSVMVSWAIEQVLPGIQQRINQRVNSIEIRLERMDQR
jgi:chromosome segregation ATPase